MTVKASRRVPWVSLVGFVTCVGACLAFLAVVLKGDCASCAASTSPYVPLAGAMVWSIAAWLLWVHRLAGFSAGTFAVASHAGLIGAEWSGACPLCLGLLGLEVTVWGMAAWRLRIWRPLQARRASLATVALVAVAAVSSGGLLMPKLLYADCPDALRRAEVPVQPPGASTLLMFMDPRCAKCAHLRDHVLPRYRDRLQWVELTRCSPQGQRLMRLHAVRAFPTLLVQRDGRVVLRVGGVDGIDRTLKGMSGPSSPTRELR